MTEVTASSEEPWTIERVVRWATEDFRGKGIESPRLDAEVLLAHALATTRVQLIIDGKRPLAKEELARFRDAVKRRRAHEPVAYLLGEREFYGRKFRVDKRVLIPRPDTEILVQVALDRSQSSSLAMQALDLCTGSGCVALTLALERPTSFVCATDLSEEAAAVARDNALRLGASNVAVYVGDLYAPLANVVDPWSDEPAPIRFDVITANPPYIPASDIPGLSLDIRGFEPHLALDGGDDGLMVMRRIVDGAPDHLKPGGVLAVEVGAGESAAVRALFEARGFRDINVTRDYARIERVVSGIVG